jgi:hypothetical protein
MNLKSVVFLTTQFKNYDLVYFSYDDDRLRNTRQNLKLLSGWCNFSLHLYVQNITGPMKPPIKRIAWGSLSTNKAEVPS